MAAAASSGTALLRSVATKMRAAPRDPLRVLLLGRSRRSAPTGSRRPFCSSSRPSAVDNKDPSQHKNVPGQSHSAKSAPMPIETKLLCLSVVGMGIYFHGWVFPRMEEAGNEMVALRIEKSILMKAVQECQRTHMKAVSQGHGDGTVMATWRTSNLAKEEATKTTRSMENRVEELEATTIKLLSEISEVKTSLQSASSSQGKA